jgi:nucleoporin NUP159
LDTINRTYRNIDIAVQQQTDDVAQLTSRISKLSVRTSGPSKPQHPARDARLPDAVVSRRPYNVTPHIAITTAAALNAERAAHKLKRALLAARKEPLLNTKAAAAPPPPSGYKSPPKAPIAPRLGVGFSATVNGPLFPVARKPEVESTPTPWTLPEDNFNPSTPLATRRGAGAGKRQHMSVPLRKSGGSPSPAASPPAATFEWGPLPVFEQAQGTTMVEAVKLTPPSSKPLAGGSTPRGWNVGLFGNKET